MSNYLNSLNGTYTEKVGADKTLLRGVLADAKGNRVKPNDLPKFASQNPDLVLRQTVSVLDKIIQKRTRLRNMSGEAYRHRKALADSIWRALLKKFDDLGIKLDKADAKALRERWDSKAHPYRLFPVDPGSGIDNNSEKLASWEESKEIPPFDSFKGRWFSTFIQRENGESDYTNVADMIIKHLFEQEVLIHGKVRENRKVDPAVPTKIGLMKARGERTKTSTNDPREEPKRRKYDWHMSDAETYFQNVDDVAKNIHDALEKVAEINERIDASWFASRVFTHFGKLEDISAELDDAKRETLWNFHNAVRGYYKALAKGTKFRLAVNAARKGDEREQAKLLNIVPKDKTVLIARLFHQNAPAGTKGFTHPGAFGGALTYAKGNADISRLIRLGKLAVHAADAVALTGSNNESDFQKAMDRLATSDGQSEIKRLETSARIWRRATSLGLRSLKGLMEPLEWGKDSQRGQTINYSDLTEFGVANEAFEALSQPVFSDHVSAQLKVLFGEKKHVYLGNETSRSAIIAPIADSTDERRDETLWAIMRISAQLRHSVFHFNIRRHLVKRVEEGFLQVDDKAWKGGGKRPSKKMSSGAARTLDQLLAFDQDLEKAAVKDQLDQIKAQNFADIDDLNTVADEALEHSETVSFALPNFGTFIERASNISKESKQTKSPSKTADLSHFATLAFRAEPEADSQFNLCKIGLLRMLYRSGFKTWMTSQEANTELFGDLLKQTLDGKFQRIDAFEREREPDKKLPTVPELVEQLGLNDFGNLPDLLRSLTSETMKTSGENRKYVPNRKAQRSMANAIEEFKKDLIAHYFAKYLTDYAFGWIKDIQADSRASCSLDDLAMNVDLAPRFSQPWHSQFYVWLYLLPPEEASLLRHQIRKSIALEPDANRETQTPEQDAENEKAMRVFADMEGLISLYTTVHAVGFQGQEHVGQLKAGASLYETPDLFDAVYDEDPDLQKYSLAGTRRGLRQLVRFAHLPALKPIFEKHRITNSEVETFTKYSAEDNTALFGEFQQLRTDIIKAETTKAKDEDKKLIQAKPRNIARYHHVARDVMIHNFDVNSARLNDHVKLHRMMMQVMGRLTDYTLMWERDGVYAAIGALYDNHPTLRLWVSKADNNKINLCYSAHDLSESEVTIYDEKYGLFAQNMNSVVEKTKLEFQHAFRRFFGTSLTENPLDEASRIKADKLDQKWRDKPRSDCSRKLIRNDLAHQNMLAAVHPKTGKKGPRVQLTSVMNAVRSLMAYDRKLKNAVPKSVKKILGDYGLQIDWVMGEQDRLKNPTVKPAKETHLAFCRKIDGQSVQLDLPRTSPRFTSMAQALFDFSHSGHSVDIKESGEEVGRKIRYADGALADYQGDTGAVRTAAMREFRLSK